MSDMRYTPYDIYCIGMLGALRWRYKIKVPPASQRGNEPWAVTEGGLEMAEITWRIFQSCSPTTPMVDFPLTHPAGELPLTRENARVYVRSIVTTFFAGQPGLDVWDTLFSNRGGAAVLVEIIAPPAMAGRYEVDLIRRVSAGCVRPARMPKEQQNGSPA
jgi:hypothetical protein